MRVSVILITYNHERFIEQALDSVLAQRTTFPFEILVTEDCSTDGTRDIIAEYARRHPDRIRLFLSERNLNTNEVTTRALDAARGDFVALLDGDDYWTSHTKLQTQVDFLDAHPECSLCFHDVAVVRDGSDQPPDTAVRSDRKPFSDVRDILRTNFIPGCSPLIRRLAVVPMPAWYRDAEWGDWPLYIVAGEHGRFGYLPEIMGVYRQHAGGYWSATTTRKRHEALIRFFRTLEAHLDPHHVRDIRHMRAYWRAELAAELDKAGDYWGATRALVAALRDEPQFRDPTVRERRRLLRSVLRRLFTRRSSAARAL